MLDSEVMCAPRSEDWGLNRATGWTLKICWRPQTCFLTGKQLWGKRAYHAVRWIHGPGDPVEDHYWISKEEFVWWNLKGRK